MTDAYKAEMRDDGGSRMSRAEAARHASLVRWGKESPVSASVQQRLAEIRAARAEKLRRKLAGGKKKGAGKGKAKAASGKRKAAAKPKIDRAKAKAEREQARKQKAAEREKARNERTAAREKARSEKQAAREQAKQGKAAERAKAKAARDQARTKRVADRAKAKKKAAKKKARNQIEARRQKAAERLARDQARWAAQAAREQAREERKKAGAKKMSDYTPILDDMEAIAGELLEVAEDDLAEIKAGRRNAAGDQAQIDKGYEIAMQLCDLFESLGADTGEEEGEEDDADMEDMEMEGKAETFGGKKRDDLKDSDFAGPNRTYPIMTAADVKDAASLIGKAENPEAVKAKIIAIAKRKGFADALPDAWKEETKKDAAFIIDGDAIKALPDGRVGAYAIRFGSEDEPDMSQMRDYFTKATDFWLDAWDRRPMLYHHAMDEDTDDAPRIGTWVKAEVKDEGVWLEGQLDRHHRYHTAIKELIKRGALRLSSDSAPHLVRRATKANGIHEVTRWPLLAASLTPTPAEPRLSAVSFKALIAELGIDDTSNQEAEDEQSERLDEAKALDDRKRRALMELDLLTLETIS